MAMAESSFLWQMWMTCVMCQLHAVARNRRRNKFIQPTHGFDSDLTETALDHGRSLMSVTEMQQYSFK